MNDNKDVAVVHWQDGGLEKKARAYTIQMLSQLIETMNKRGFVYWVCLTQLDTIIPIRSHTSYTESLTPAEYVGKSEPTKTPHRAFVDVIRTKQARHPPTPEQVKKAYELSWGN